MTNIYKKEAVKFAIELVWIAILGVIYGVLHQLLHFGNGPEDLLLIPGLLVIDMFLLRERRSRWLDRLLSGKRIKVGP